MSDICGRRFTVRCFLLTASAAAAILLIAGCKPRAAKETSAPIETLGLPVGVQAVARGSIENRLTLSGILAPEKQVAFMSKLAGKLTQVNIKEGQSVIEGEGVAAVNRDEPGQDYKNYTVTAPMTGVIAKVMLDPGSMISPTVPIAMVMSTNNLKVTINVIESEISSVRAGQRADVTVPAYPDRTFPASVSNILPIVDPMSHTAKVELTIPNGSHTLKPGMSATVRLMLGKHDDAVVVPKSATIEKMGEKYVYLFDNGRTKRANVQTGYDDGALVEILAGVQPGDRLITTDLNVLKDGSKVRAKEQ
jgi:multidrug efflux pump subunit AcrA (membrane-fusion protein)